MQPNTSIQNFKRAKRNQRACIPLAIINSIMLSLMKFLACAFIFLNQPLFFQIIFFLSFIFFPSQIPIPEGGQ